MARPIGLTLNVSRSSGDLSGGLPSPSVYGAPPPPQSTPVASRGQASASFPFAQPQPVNHINLAAALAQLDFGRASSPLLMGANSFGSVSPSPSGCDSPMRNPVRPFSSTPNGSPALVRPQPAGQQRQSDGRAPPWGGGLTVPSTPNRRARLSDSAAEFTRSFSHDGDYDFQRASDGGSSAGGRGSGGSADVVIDISPAINPYLLHYATPAPKDGGTIHCRVLRSRGKKRLISYRMLTESGEELLTAVRQADDFLISMTSSELMLAEGSASGPLDWAKAQKSSFSILRCPPDVPIGAELPERRDFFAYNAVHNGRELVPTGEPIIAISHGTVMASSTLPQVNTMRAAFPDPEQGAPACTRAYLLHAIEAIGGKSGKAVPVDEAAEGTPAADKGKLVPAGVCALSSRVPVWNARTESYVLNFHGRATLASSKNVQLLHWAGGVSPMLDRGAAAAEGSSKGKDQLPTLLYGKVDRDTYNLDYKFPLSAFHAFVIGISVTDW